MHVGPAVKRTQVQAIVGAANALDADAPAITGDRVDGRLRDLYREPPMRLGTPPEITRPRPVAAP